MKRLSDRVAIVTGGGRGLGRAIALELAKEGAHVAMMARSAPQVEAVAHEVEALGVRALPVTGDVSQWSSAETIVQKVMDTFGRVDILINNAGVLEPVKPAYRVDPLSWSYHLDVNLKGPFFMSRAVLPHMVERRSGVIVNIGSGAAHRPVPSWSAYCTAKAGLLHLTRVLAEELKEVNIRVNIVRPGRVDTDMQRLLRSIPPEDMDPKIVESYRRQYEEGRLYPPDFPARLIVWLCTDEAQDVSGQEVNIDEAVWRERAGLT